MVQQTPAIPDSPSEPLITKPRRNMYALLISIMASMTSILLGYDTGVMSGATIYIQRDLKVTDTQIEILVGTINIYSLVGSAMAGWTSDWLGRRVTIIIASAVFFIGAAVMGFSNGYWVLMAGRFVAGLGVGYAMMIAPVYAAEVAPASSRGFLTSFPEVFINFGVLLGYLSNYAFAKCSLKLGWRLMLGVGAVPAVFIALGVIIMPESPRWLVMQGRLGDAKKVLERTSDSLQEAHLRLADITSAAGISYSDSHADTVAVKKSDRDGKNVWKDLFLHPTRPVLHITVVALGLHFFQQATGVDSLVMYSPRVYDKVGIKSDQKKLLATIMVGVCKTVFILVTTFMVDRVGRRMLLLTSCGGQVVSNVILGVSLMVIDRYGAEEFPWLVVVCVLMTYASVGFFSMGMGPVVWVYSSEIFPLRLRSQGCGMGVVVNRATSGVMLMTFISIYKAISMGGAFLMFGGIGVVTWVFAYALLPETRGRTLEDMEVLFGSFLGWRKTARELRKKEELEEEHNRYVA